MTDNRKRVDFKLARKSRKHGFMDGLRKKLPTRREFMKSTSNKVNKVKEYTPLTDRHSPMVFLVLLTTTLLQYNLGYVWMIVRPQTPIEKLLTLTMGLILYGVIQAIIIYSKQADIMRKRGRNVSQEEAKALLQRVKDMERKGLL